MGMKVYFPPGVGLNEPITAIEKEAHNPSPRTRSGLLDDATALGAIVLQCPPYGIQRSIERIVECLLGFASTQGLAGQKQDDTHFIGSLDVVRGFVHYYPGAQNIVM